MKFSDLKTLKSPKIAVIKFEFFLGGTEFSYERAGGNRSRKIIERGICPPVPMGAPPMA